MHGFPDGVEDDEERGERIGPPPAERVIEDKSDQNRASEERVDERDTSLGEKDRISQRSSGPGLFGGKRGHHDRGDACPDDAGGTVGWAVLGEGATADVVAR